jgi:cell division protein FtsQ
MTGQQARRAGAPGRTAAAPDHGAPGRGTLGQGAVRRRPDPWKTAFFGVLAAAIVAAVAWSLLGSSLLVVRSVRVSGTPLVSRARILAASGIQLGMPLIRIDPAAVAHRIEQISQVQSARVTRDWPDTVVISVRDRVPALALPSGGRFALVDASGVIVRWAAAAPPGMPLLEYPAGPASSLRGSPLVRAAVAVLHQIPASLRRRLIAMRVPSADRVTMILRHRVTIVWGSPGRSAAKARELAALMRTNASYYDVSDPETAVTGR